MTKAVYDLFRREGYVLAGGLRDLSQRACVYHHMYADSGGNNVFPLIAAHGALWASGYFKKGMIAGKLLSAQYISNPRLRQSKLQALSEFADKFRDINRRVCAESYALYYYTKRVEMNDFISSIINENFSALLYECHRTQKNGKSFCRKDREALFYEFFRWEQENIVAPAVSAAYAQLHWPAVKYLSLRPKVQFSYFGKSYALPFENFSSKSERMKNGILAYRRAEEVGLALVEHALRDYKIMPEEFFRNTNAYYRDVEISCSTP